jgi:hypothetical protein
MKPKLIILSIMAISLLAAGCGKKAMEPTTNNPQQSMQKTEDATMNDGDQKMNAAKNNMMGTSSPSSMDSIQKDDTMMKGTSSTDMMKK